MGPEQEITYRPIGVILSPFRAPKGTPIQPAAARGAEGKVIVFSGYVPGLHDLDGFSHVILIYHFHLSGEAKLRVRPYMDDREHGVFAARAPARPNPIGLSVVRLLKIEGNVLHVADVDIVDGTPLLDIKPYVPPFDAAQEVRIGWLAGREAGGRSSSGPWIGCAASGRNPNRIRRRAVRPQRSRKTSSDPLYTALGVTTLLGFFFNCLARLFPCRPSPSFLKIKRCIWP